MKRLVFILLVSCAGDPFVLDLTPETASPRTDYAIPQEAATQASDDVRDLPDAGGWNGDSGSTAEVGVDGRVVDSAITPAVEAGLSREAQVPEAQAGCPPPVASDGYSNVCATYPTRGMTFISTFPGECACDWTCACLMKSSICPGGRPQSCQWVNGSVCNSIVLAAVTCQ